MHNFTYPTTPHVTVCRRGHLVDCPNLLSSSLFTTQMFTHFKTAWFNNVEHHYCRRPSTRSAVEVGRYTAVTWSSWTNLAASVMRRIFHPVLQQPPPPLQYRPVHPPSYWLRWYPLLSQRQYGHLAEVSRVKQRRHLLVFVTVRFLVHKRTEDMVSYLDTWRWLYHWLSSYCDVNIIDAFYHTADWSAVHYSCVPFISATCWPCEHGKWKAKCQYVENGH